MQTIWSRIAQVRGGCRCPQCLSSAHGITRRAGTTATRAGPKYLTSSTLWYSGIFAAAATFDAGVKQQRREKWDRAIAEVRQELGQEEGVGVSEDMFASQLVEEDHVFAQASEERLPEMETDAVERPEADPFSVVEPTYRRPRWPTNTGPQLQVHNLAPESIYANETRRSRNETRSWTAKKLELVGLSIDMLQYSMFLALHERGLIQEAASSVPTEYGELMRQTPEELVKNIKSLKDELHIVKKFEEAMLSYEPSPERERLRLNKFTPALPSQSSISAPHDLNVLLQRLFKNHRKGYVNTPSLLAEICYTLSWTPSPPSLDTFNTLLLGMQNVNEPTITSKILSSVRACHLRPNEITISAALNHYTKTSNASAFLAYVETMRGKHGGLSLARPDVLIGAACQGRLVRKENHPEKVIQLPYPTPMVFSALITGVIKFGGFDTALDVCKNMGEEGWGLCMSGLAPLLHDCAERQDWQSGAAVWDQIKWLETRSRRQAGREKEQFERIPMGVFASMLRLCLGEGDRAMYDDVWRHATIQSRYKSGLLIQRVKRQVPGTAPVKPAPKVDTEFRTIDLNDTAVQEPDEDIVDPPTARAVQDEHLTERMVYQPRHIHEEAISMEQLHGNMPGNQNLDDYEIAERPMEMHA